MPRKTPTCDADRLGGLDVTPVKYTAEFFTSKESDKFFMKGPNLDSVGDTIESFYVQEKLEHISSTEQLERLGRQQDVQLKLSVQRASRLYKDQNQLRARLLNVNSFLREFSEKKAAAQRKISDEVKVQRQLAEDIELMMKKMDDLKVFKKQLEATVAEYKPYESVLTEAVNKTCCPSIEALMNRCDAIMVAQSNIEQMNDELFREIDGMREKLVDILKQVTMVYGGLMNELSKMTRSYYKAKAASLEWEKILRLTNLPLIENFERRERNRDAVNQIYQMFCTRRGVSAEIPRSHVEEQLDFVKSEFELLQAVLMAHKDPNFDFI